MKKSKHPLQKNQLITIISERLQSERGQVTRVYDALVEIAKKELIENGEFRLSGLGVFVLRKRDERKRNNPRTGEKVIALPSVGIGFRPSPLLKQKIGEVVFIDKKQRKS